MTEFSLETQPVPQLSEKVMKTNAALEYIRLTLLPAFICVLSAGCMGVGQGHGQPGMLALLLGGDRAPALAALSISDTQATSISLAKPTLTAEGNPAPSISAYIGIDGTVSVNGSSVAQSLQGPFDVGSAGRLFSGLSPNTTYRIIVIASNSAGYSVRQMAQSTGTGAPVLDSLAVSASDSSSITLSQPSFTTAGNPAPTVSAYIGLNGTITVTGSNVTGSLSGPFDVSTGGKTFGSLSANTSYKIVVVASNAAGYSVQQITTSTAGIAPVLNALNIASADSSSITVSQPTFATAGNPTPAVVAYIGVNGTISLSGSNVSNAVAGPVDVSASSYQFTALSPNTTYRVIVIAANSGGYSAQQILQSTAGIAPVLSSLSVSATDSSSISLSQPGFSVSGNPAPTVSAYIGLNGTISASGSTVSNSLQGPFNVASGGKQFSSLAANTSYRVIVVASNADGYSVQQIVQSTAGIAPVLNSLSITTSDSSSITLSQPTFSTAGNPSPTVSAYIGLNGTISVSGSTVSNSTAGPVDVSTGGTQFSSLSSNTSYRIIVVASNSAGYYVQQIVQSTAGVAPVLNNLSVSGTDSVSITLGQPTFATSGNPAPTVSAYIGLNGTISVTGSTVSNSTTGPVDVSSSGKQFTGLSANTSYRIIVVASNSAGYYMKEIVQSTAGIAPVMDNLAISSSDSTSITISQPTFSTAGNPSPTVSAYIGLDGTISVSGTTVSNSTAGPVSVASGGHQFSSLSSNTTYRIIVVSQNSAGSSVQQIVQATAGIAPVLNSISASRTSTSITISQPTFSTAGNPSPTTQAWIGTDGTISISGATVSNSSEGPINVSTGGYQFSGLTTGTVYRIIVVSTNAVGSSVKQLTMSAPSTTATMVYGQPDFTSSTCSNGGVSATSLCSAQGIAMDSGGNVFIADTSNVRVLYYPAGSTTATRVYGQPNMTSTTVNNGGISATSMTNPYGITAEPAGGLYIGDAFNNRILYYPPGSTTATRVYGQPDMASGTLNNGGVSANSIGNARGLFLDTFDNLYVCDSFNNRVLFFPSGSTTATRVYGQPNMTSNAVNNGGVSANSLNGPRGVVADSSGNVYVADWANNRVLYYPSGSTTATRVYGQPDMTSTTSNNGGVTASSLNAPSNVTLDAAGNLYVLDSNLRVLVFTGTSTTASFVYGQTNMTSATSGVSTTQLSGSYMGLFVDTKGRVFAGDGSRVVVFP